LSTPLPSGTKTITVAAYAIELLEFHSHYKSYLIT